MTGKRKCSLLNGIPQQLNDGQDGRPDAQGAEGWPKRMAQGTLRSPLRAGSGRTEVPLQQQQQIYQPPCEQDSD